MSVQIGQQRQIGHQRKHSLQAGGPRVAAQVQGDHRRAPCNRNPDPDARLMLDPTQCRPLLQRRKNACVAQPHGISTTREHPIQADAMPDRIAIL